MDKNVAHVDEALVGEAVRKGTTESVVCEMSWAAPEVGRMPSRLGADVDVVSETAVTEAVIGLVVNGGMASRQLVDISCIRNKFGAT